MANRSVRFGVAARRQQARFRGTLPLEARTCDDAKGQRNAHLLACGHESHNLFESVRHSAPEFFRRRRIKWWTSARSGDRPGDHPTRNLASSQIACANFLLPLAPAPGALTAFLRAIDPDVDSVLDIVDAQGNCSPVEFEWVGWDEPLEGGAITRGANQTSIDAFMVAKTRSSTRAYLLEWKYCEEYLRPADKGEGASGDTRRRRYEDLFHGAQSPFSRDTVFDEFLYEPFYQIMRLLLLGRRMCERGVTRNLQVDEAKVVVVCPEANTDYRQVVTTLPLSQRFPHLKTVEEVVHASLQDPTTFAFLGPEQAMAAIRHTLGGVGVVQQWADYHSLRYGW